MKYTMSEEQYRRLMDACKPVPYMVFGGREPRSPRENAEDVWRELGKEMGFVWDSARPAYGESDRVFMATPLPSGRPRRHRCQFAQLEVRKGGTLIRCRSKEPMRYTVIGGAPV